jgi:hypothetical protein
MKLWQALVAVFALSCAVALAQGPRRDGNWEMTVQMEIPGMPQKMPPMTIKQCITKEQADDPSVLMPPQQPGRGGAPDCKVTDQKMSGNTLSWTMTCAGATPMTGTGEMSYTDDTVNGTIKMTMENAGQPMTMTMNMKGKRLGDCVK